ncbi:restriction endonuclease subunit S [Streptomyces sp. NPDC058240]|uniref:restriction endonuclease subunit S n=1 Tax=Streptomyces sp. NPDC058240 TaxID=3346396 RepID=UPI0036E5E9BE
MTEKTQLSRVCDIIMGQAPNGASYNTTREGWALIAGAGDFSAGRLAPKKWTTEASKLSKPGDIVLSIRASIGAKVWSDGEFCLGRGVAALRARVGLNQEFLWHWVTFKERELVAKGKGATFLQVNRSDIGELGMELPSLAQQHRIAAVLDRVDALRAKRREAILLLHGLAQSIFLDMFGDPVLNPKGWPVLPFGEVCDTRLGKMLDAKRETGRNSRPYLRNANVQWFRINTTDLLEMDFDGKDKITYGLVPGDLMICEGGEPGRAAIWRGEVEDCYFQKALHRARPNVELARAEYLVWMLRILSLRGGLSDHVSTATIAHLTGAKLKVLPISLPPLRLQQEFASRLDALEETKKRHESHLATLDELFESLQQRAFAGQLWDHEAA